MHIVRTAALLLLTVFVISCGSSSSADAEVGDGAPATTGTRAAAGASDMQADMEELRDYELNFEDLQKYLDAQLNMMRAAQASASSASAEPEAPEDEADAEGDMVASEDPNTLGGMEARVERTPFMRKAVEDAGLDAREYATIAFTYMTSAMAAGVVKMGRPVDSVATAMKVNPDNINFILQNEAKLAPLFQRMEAEAKKLEGGE